MTERSSVRLPAGFKCQRRVAHEDAAARFGQRAVGGQARDHARFSRDDVAAYLDSLLDVVAVYHTILVDFSVNPYLAVVIDVGLEI